MKYLLTIVLLLTSACSSSYSDTIQNELANYEAEIAQKQVDIDKAVKRGDITLVRQYYKPNLNGERWYKVQDQFECWWWISNGHKFDHNQIDVLPNGEANCKDQKYAPEKPYIYFDRQGKQFDSW